MRLAAALLLGAVSSVFGAERNVELIVPVPAQWLRVYPLSPYKEHWSMIIEVGDLEKEKPRFIDIFRKGGAPLTQPLEFFPFSQTDKTQQLSFRSSLKSAQSILKTLRKRTAVKELRQRPAVEPVSLAEVKGKIDRLNADRKAHAVELAAMPAVSSLVEELLGHLMSVRSIQESSDREVLINVTLKEKAR